MRNLKPDLGMFLYDPDWIDGPHIFYDVPITNLYRVEHNLFCSSINYCLDGNEYCITSQLPYLVDRFPNEKDERTLLSYIAHEKHFKYDFIQPFKMNIVQCTVGEMYVNNNEAYRPSKVIRMT